MATTSGECANCGKSTTRTCTGCHEGIDGNGSALPTVYYCNKECQKQSWCNGHKVVCRNRGARKQLYRGASLVQEAFYAFREVAFDRNPSAIIPEGNKLHLYLSPSDHEPLHAFPGHLVSKDEDKKAILVWNACSVAGAYMFKLLEKVFEGIGGEKYCAMVANLKIKGDRKKIVVHHPDGSIDNEDYSHTVIRFPFQDGKQYILDLAGAQYGQYNVVMPLNQYMSTWVREREDEEELEYTEKRWKKAARYRDDPRLPADFDYRAFWLQHEIAKVMHDRVGKWEIKGGKTIAKMLRQKQSEFEADKNALLAAITTAMRDWIDEWETKGRHIPPAEPRGEPQTLGDVLDLVEREGRTSAVLNRLESEGRLRIL